MAEGENQKTWIDGLSVKYCRKCGNAMKVHDTRQINGAYIRYRSCAKCKITLKTIEIPYYAFEALKGDKNGERI